MENIVFFVQAEDGIRVLTVTGVQTCALPIFGPVVELVAELIEPLLEHVGVEEDLEILGIGWQQRARNRSEERRVGKECRSRVSAHCCKKKGGERRRERHRGEAAVRERTEEVA